MLLQNQEKARSIYDTFKERLTQKNQMIQGLTDQVSQLKFMIDNAEKMFNAPFEEPEDMKRTAAYMLDTDAPLEALRPAMAVTTIADENERVVDLGGDGENAEVNLVSDGKMYVQNLESITEQMKEIHWSVLEAVVESGVSEVSAARRLVAEKVQDGGEPVSSEKHPESSSSWLR